MCRLGLYVDSGQKLSELHEAILETTDDDAIFERELVRADEEQIS